jgi:hypothetical protein
MQYFKDRLYIVTSDGTLCCIDVSEAAIAAAKQGTLPTAAVIKPDRDLKAASLGDKLETAGASEGVLVECYAEGGRVRVRPKSPGFKPKWHVQFPRNIRNPGTTYVVDGLAEARGGFYRVVGKIRTLGGEGVAKTSAKKVAKQGSKTSAKKVAKADSEATAKKVAKATTKTVAKKVAKTSAKKVAAKKTPAKKVAKKTTAKKLSKR